MPERLLMKELSKYRVGTWADIIYRNALLYPNDTAFVYDPEAGELDLHAHSRVRTSPDRKTRFLARKKRGDKDGVALVSLI